MAAAKPPPSDAAPGHNAPVFGVSELASNLKRTVEEAYGRVRVRGEVSRPSFASSGHCYLRLKDDQAVLDGIIWRGVLSKLAIRPEDGMEVVATGRLTTYPGRSSYQIIIDSLELAGEGALLKLLEERRKKLAAEGLFDEARKRRLPFLPEIVGVVTSPTGAVIRDILHRLADRFPRPVLVWPVRVQGDGAAEQVAEAIAGFDALPRAGGPVPRPDLLIVARGGGSLEDLMAFNEEAVVRAVAACSIPVISAVGHETDTTLVDFVADRRAPTPTGAAEMAVPVRLDLVARISELSTRQREAMRRALRDRAEGLVGLSRGLPDLPALLEDRIQRLDDVAARLEQAPGRLLAGKSDGLAVLAAALPHPGTVIHLKAAGLQTAARALTTAGRATLDQAAARLDRTAATLRPTVLSAEVTQASQRVSELSGRLDRAFALHRERASTRLSGLGDRLENVSYHRVLERGYAVLRSEDGRVVSKQAGIGEGTALTASLQDGSLAMVVTDGGASPKPKPEARSKPRRPSPKAARQTSLFD